MEGKTPESKGSNEQSSLTLGDMFGHPQIQHLESPDGRSIIPLIDFDVRKLLPDADGEPTPES